MGELDELDLAEIHAALAIECMEDGGAQTHAMIAQANALVAIAKSVGELVENLKITPSTAGAIGEALQKYVDGE